MPPAKFPLRCFPKPSEYRCKFCDRKIMKNFFEQNVTTLPDMFWHRALRLAVASPPRYFSTCSLSVCSVSSVHYCITATRRWYVRLTRLINVRSDTARRDAAKGVETRACLGGADTRVSSPVLPTNYRYYDPLPFLKVPPWIPSPSQLCTKRQNEL